MAIFSLSSGSQPPASPVSSTASSAVTVRDDDDVFSVDSDFLSDAGYVSADDGIVAPPATSDWLSVLDDAPPAAAAPTARDGADHAPDDEIQAAVRDADDAGAAPPAATMPMLPDDWTSEPHGSRSAVAADASDTPAAAASQLATLSVFAHNATSFACIACNFSATQLAELRHHRRRQHRDRTFTDVFHSGCACAASFAHRAAATRHSLHCGTASITSGAAPTMQQPPPADTPAAGRGPTVTRRNPPPDSATSNTSSFRPWRAHRSRLHVFPRFTALAVRSPMTESSTLLSGHKRRRVDPSPASHPGEDVDMELRADDHATAFLRRMMAYTPVSSTPITATTSSTTESTVPPTPTPSSLMPTSTIACTAPPTPAPTSRIAAPPCPAPQARTETTPLLPSQQVPLSAPAADASRRARDSTRWAPSSTAPQSTLPRPDGDGCTDDLANRGDHCTGDYSIDDENAFKLCDA
ncbi:hypothetical protein PRIC1_004541 [Phytophthora ramorum]